MRGGGGGGEGPPAVLGARPTSGGTPQGFCRAPGNTPALGNKPSSSDPAKFFSSKVSRQEYESDPRGLFGPGSYRLSEFIAETIRKYYFSVSVSVMK